MISKKKVRLLCLLAAAAVLFCFTACKHKTEELPQLEQAPEYIEVPEDTVEDMPQIQAVDPRGVGLAGYTMDNGPLCERRADDPSPTVIQGSEALPESFGRWWRVCVWDSAAQGYTVHYYDRSEGDTMLQLASTALSHLYGDDSGISVASAAVHKSFAIIDVALEENSAAAAALADEDAVRTLLNSVYTTFVSNNFYQCGFTLNGGKFALGGISLQDDGYGHYEDAPALYSLPAAPGAYSAIRAQFPYPYGNGIPRVEAPYEKNDINHIREYSQIYSLLYYARDVGEYASPEAIDAEKIIAGGLSLAPDTYDCAMQPENFPLYPLNEFLLDPLAAAVNDFQFTPEEWVAAAAKQLWGPNLTVTHTSLGDEYIYHEAEGVYTPPHRGGGSSVTPYIHSITETEGGYLAEVSYVKQSMPGTWDEAAGEWIPGYDITDPAILELIESRLPRYEVFVSCTDNMTMHLQSCKAL